MRLTVCDRCKTDKEVYYSLSWSMNVVVQNLDSGSRSIDLCINCFKALEKVIYAEEVHVEG